jgi:transposase-like protein
MGRLPLSRGLDATARTRGIGGSYAWLAAASQPPDPRRPSCGPDPRGGRRDRFNVTRRRYRAAVKYTPEMLRTAVAASRSMADVLRHLRLPPNGGAHAHLRRRITAFGIDTSHFLGRAHRRGTPAITRLTPDEVLVLRRPDRVRAAPDLLRRALVEVGRPYRCSICGLEATWNGRQLTLHVDHVNGQFWDCRRDNLRFLCPNCHSQTPTYAGRNRRRFGSAVAPARAAAGGGDVAAPAPMTEAEVTELLARVDRGEVTVTAAARRIGCHRNHVYRIRRRLVESGLGPRPRRAYRAETCRDAVVAYALANPDRGPKTIARALRERSPDPVRVSHGTIATILHAAGLATREGRRRAAAAAQPALWTDPLDSSAPAGVAERQTRQI